MSSAKLAKALETSCSARPSLEAICSAVARFGFDIKSFPAAMAALKVILQDRKPHEAKGRHVENEGHYDPCAEDQNEQRQRAQFMKPPPLIAGGEEPGSAAAIAIAKIESSSVRLHSFGLDFMA
jgi:hypothetical protein